jgi:hypothetical protein
MATCDDGEVCDHPEIVGADGTDAYDPEISRLIEWASEKYALSERHEVDVHSAVTSALANYLLTFEGAIAGRSCALQWVISDWAEQATGARGLPSAAVYITDEVERARDSGFAPGRPHVIGQLGGEQITIVGTALFETEMLRVDVMCPDKEMRRGVMRMLELGLAPVPWMAGFKLVLPRYHNAIATFLVLATAFPDGPETAQQSLWPIRLRLRVACQEYRTHAASLARSSASGTIS